MLVCKDKSFFIFFIKKQKKPQPTSYSRLRLFFTIYTLKISITIVFYFSIFAERLKERTTFCLLFHLPI